MSSLTFSPRLAGATVLEGALRLMHGIHDSFAFDSSATNMTTPVMRVCAERCGVCRDFADVAISCQRSLGLAARTRLRAFTGPASRVTVLPVLMQHAAPPTRLEVRHKRRERLLAITTVVISTTLSLVLADVALEVIARRQTPTFYTNLTPGELSKLPVMTAGTITGTYVDAIVDMPWHEPGRSWTWAGQRDRAVEFLVKGRWNNIGCHDEVDYPMSDRPADRKSTRLNSSH